MAVAGIYSVGGADQRRSGFSRTFDTSGLIGAGSLREALAKARGSGLSDKAVKSWWAKYGQVGGGGGGAAGGSGLTPSASGAFQKAIEYYEPGGGFGAGVEAALERGQTKALAAGGQALASAGLAGTSMMAGLGKKYEEEVAAPTRAGVESERAERLSGLYASMAGAEQAGYESAADRALRGGIAGGQLGLGYAQLGAAQERAYLNAAAQNRAGTSTGTTTGTAQPIPDLSKVISGGEGSTGGNSWGALWDTLKNKTKTTSGFTLPGLINEGRATNALVPAANTLAGIDRGALGFGMGTSNLSFAKQAAMGWQ